MLATITILITVIITFRINNYLDYNRKLRENLTISKIIPKSTTIGEKVVIERETKFEGRNLTTIVGPAKVKGNQDA